MIEVEVRSPLLPNTERRLISKLETMTLREENVSLDVYYDTQDLDLLRHRQIVFVRLRDNHLLQFKFDDNTQQRPACIERAFVMQAGNVPTTAQSLFRTFLPSWQETLTWKQAITKNQLVELAHIEKTRRVYVDGPLCICVDHIKDLGDFVEIERTCEEGTDPQAAEEQVYAILEEIQGMPLKAGYLEIWLYRHNPTAYQYVPRQFHVEETLMRFP